MPLRFSKVKERPLLKNETLKQCTEERRKKGKKTHKKRPKKNLISFLIARARYTHTHTQREKEKDDTMAAAAERSTNDAGFVGEEDEASRVGDLYGALNVETTATSIEVRFCFFPLYSFFL